MKEGKYTDLLNEFDDETYYIDSAKDIVYVYSLYKKEDFTTKVLSNIREGMEIILKDCQNRNDYEPFSIAMIELKDIAEKKQVEQLKTLCEALEAKKSEMTGWKK